MSEEEQKAFKLYGKLPAKNLITKMQKVRAEAPRSALSLTIGRSASTLTRVIT